MAKPDLDLLMFLATMGAEGLGEADNKVTWETPLTLIVHGMLMTGQVISRKKYMDLLLEDLKSANVGGENGRSAWQGVTAGLERAMAEHGTDAGDTRDYVYLRNVGILNVTRGSMIRRTTWCVRLSEVAGVMLGTPSDD